MDNCIPTDRIQISYIDSPQLNKILYIFYNIITNIPATKIDKVIEVAKSTTEFSGLFFPNNNSP